MNTFSISSFSFASCAVLLTVSTLTGCTAPKIPDPKATVMQVVEKFEPVWQAPLPHGGDTSQLKDWWQQWQDPALSKLQVQAQEQSTSMAQASARIEQSRASLVIAGASEKPSVDANSSLRRSALGVPPFGAPRTSVSTSFDASWELDLFGAIARGKQAAQSRVGARELDWHEARVSLAGEVASHYVNYRVCLELVQKFEEDSAALSSTVSLTEQKVKVGFTAPADAAVLRASLANSRNQVIAQKADCQLWIKALAYLTAQSDAQVMSVLAESSNQPLLAASFAVNQVPAQALARRPDLASLEQELAALAAEIGAAEANRKPRLSFTGSLGWGALRFGGATGGETGSGVSWGFGPALSLPIFDAGRRKASVDLAAARYQEISAQYQQKARLAVREVEESLLRLRSAQDRLAQAEAAIKDFQAYLAAAQTRYQVGVGNLIELQEARRQTVAAQVNLVNLRRERLAQWIALYKALGGGWDASAHAS